MPPERLEAAEKGALPCDPSSSDPAGKRKRKRRGAVEACCCDRGTTGEAPPRSAKEADEDQALDSPDEDFRGIVEDATSAEQERRSKPRTSCSGQSQAKEREKFQEIREGQHNVSGRALQSGP